MSVPAQRQPALRPEVLLSPAMRRGAARVHVVKDPASGKSFEVGPKECFLMARLDGQRTLAGIGEEYARHFGRALGEAHWRRLLGLLWERGLLVGAEPIAPVPAEPPPRPTPWKGKLRLVADAGAATERLYRATGFALSARFLLPVLALVGVMETTLVLRLDGFVRDTGWLLSRPVPLLAVFSLLWVSTALHELAHGVVARHFGGTVGEIGLRWHLPMVFMYCEVGNYLYLRSRWAQMATAMAGTVMNLVFLLPFAALWAVLPAGDPVRAAVAGLLTLGTAQALVNLVPLPPLDGYRMLAHALGMADYATESRRFLRLLSARVLRRGPGVGAYPRGARIAYAAYGVGSVALVGGSGVGFVLLCHHFLADRYGVLAAVVPALLVAVLVAVTGPWARRGKAR
ncbi:peptidase M50 [Streptomyces sp. QH1-20]|uniref:peptidase M50 n=1 Tax=Streptomyces sp. QH1-20 TaxID=3240934 RepID=UPI0035171CCE